MKGKKAINKIIFILFIISLFLQNLCATYVSLDKNVKKAILNDEQRKIFKKQKKNKIKLPPNTYRLNKFKLENKKDFNCIQIKNVKIEGSTVYKKAYFKNLIKPLLNTCTGISKLNNLTKEISNIYINDGYITSRAYLKPQNLTKGIVLVSILEGKVEKIISSKINSENLYSNFENKILNIRDIEVGVQQAQRLKSQSVKFELLPGTKTAYTIVKILGKKESNNLYGSLSLDNYGSKSTGKYQYSLNLNYDNPLNLNDIISLGLNDTNHITKSTNKFAGLSLSYSIPYERLLFNLSSTYSKYEQLNKDIFNDVYKSDGDSRNYTFDVSYKLFHNKNNMLEISSGFEYKTSNNFLNDVKLEIQSYKLSVFNVGLKHTYNSNSIYFYSLFHVYKGLNIFGAKENFAQQESSFLKYVLDLNFTKYFQSKYNIKYNMSFRGQTSKNRLFATEEISMGGPYSVRGFKQTGLSGPRGLYVRNELSFAHNFKPFIISPYLAIDYGNVKKDIDSVDGSIWGSALGIRTSYKNTSFEIFYTKYLKEAVSIKDQNKNFIGFNLSYEF